MTETEQKLPSVSTAKGTTVEDEISMYIIFFLNIIIPDGGAKTCPIYGVKKKE